MPGTMPYHLEKGPYFSTVEDFCNSSKANLEAALVSLRDPTQPIPAIGGVLASPAIAAGPYTAAEIQRHLYADWFGYRQNATGGWDPQPPFNWPGNTRTGYWQQYYGDVQGILRETLRRAAEVALGIDHHDDIPPGGAPRHWPIEFFWKCGQPWWEGWVTWRYDADADRGQVTVILATPSTGDPVLTDPTRGRTSADFLVDPSSTRSAANAEHHQGMWVVTHHDEQPYMSMTTAPTPPGQWPLLVLGTAYRGVGDVVTVQPSWADGGAPPA